MNNFTEYTTKSGKHGLRKLNPETNELYKSGDTREDGAVFIGYNSYIKKNGFFAEKWNLKNVKKEVPLLDTSGRRINPETGKIFKRGDTREDGKFFVTYTQKGLNGMYYEQWLTSLMKYNLTLFVGRCYQLKNRAKEMGLPFNVTPEYLEKIYPEDNKCAILGTIMKKATVDKIVPELGYTRGNVAWVDYNINRKKNDLTMPELELIIRYLKKYSPSRSPYQTKNSS
tara:strand:- start:10473 stop:11153 length:681 start_codon:yes stop_codon:yes gene_type:complete